MGKGHVKGKGARGLYCPAIKYLNIVIPAPHPVRDKLQPESRWYWMPDQFQHDGGSLFDRQVIFGDFNPKKDTVKRRDIV